MKIKGAPGTANQSKDVSLEVKFATPQISLASPNKSDAYLFL